MSGKWRLPRGERTGQSARITANHVQRPPKQLRETVAGTFTRNCSPNTHVEPTTRRLGGRFSVAISTRYWKEHPVYCWHRAVDVVYVAVVLELSWSSANDAQLSFLVLSSASVCAPSHPHLLQLHTHNAIDRSFINLPLLGVPASIAFGYVFRRGSCNQS
jgi:hypothetical protein